MSGPLLLAGGGKMGGALLAGWLAGGTAPENVVVVEPDRERAAALAKRHGVVVRAAPADIDPGFRPATVVFAVKPQAMDEVVPAYRAYAGPDVAFLSIAAGTPVAYFQSRLGPDAVVVRAMPNTPAAVGRGMSVVYADPMASEDQRRDCAGLLEAVGRVAWVDDEELLHAVTAVSGSGPAYVFLMVECLARAGVEAGLPEALAAELAYATVVGSAALMEDSDEPPSQLRENVTSPGGTTRAALDVLMAADGLQPLMTAAVAAAARRSRELAGG